MLQIPSDFRATGDGLTLSRFAHQCLAADPGLRARLDPALVRSAQAMRERLSTLLAADASGTSSADALARAVRQLKREVHLTVIDGDLGGRLGLADVTEAMTLLAEVTLDATARWHFDDLVRIHGQPCDDAGAPQPFIVVGMGKLGGRELNVSSDIDLIFLYPEDGDTVAGDGQKSLANQEFFTRLGRRVIGAMSEVTAHGYVFRVDMRLRPNGDSGPLVASHAMLERYFFVQGREWERYAWIKARVVAAVGAPTAACTAAIAEIEALRRPFVFRKYLDYGAIEALRDLHRQIRAEVGKRAALHPERAINVKLGRGGIREIEFTAQVYQLIRGGRIRRLQTRATCDVLALLASNGQMPQAQADGLIQGYGFLRALEHRLQYLDDAQTHSLPAAEDDRRVIASMMGFERADDLLAQLERVQRFVADVFDHIFDAPSQDDARTPELTQWFGPELLEPAGLQAATEALRTRGFAEAETIAQRLAALVRGGRYRNLPEVSRQRLDRLVCSMLDFVSTQARQAELAGRFIDLLDTIAPRSAYLSLLSEYPAALQRVGRMLAASPWAAAYLTRHPILLDELLDERQLRERPNWQAERRELDAHLAEAQLADGRPDVERQMDVLRETHHAWSFRLLAQDLDGLISIEALADDLSALADMLLDATLSECWRQLPNKHRETPTFAVIAYGKLGGKELGYASDLDLVFVHDDASHGGENERSTEVYARLAQRMIGWLTSHTSAGRLFDVDMRLRPNGNAGMLVTSMTAFDTYQAQRGSNTAWIWEHQALTRARFCAGHAATGERFEALRQRVLRLPRDATTLLTEVAAMRRRIHDGHPNRTAHFDLKHDAGGMIDIEFIVQTLVLLHAAALPDLADNKGNIALLQRAADHGLLDPSLAQACADAYRTFRATQHALRLQAEGDAGPARVAGDAFSSERRAVQAAWAAVFGASA